MTKSEGKGDTDFANEVVTEIRRVVQSVTINSRRFYRDTGLTVPQLLCLQAIGGAEPKEITAAGVARRVSLSPATVTGILDRLEREGFIQRVRHAQDRRKICLFVTPKGRERLETSPMPFQERFQSRLAKLDEKDRQVILDSLRRVVEMLGAENIEAAPILVTGDVKVPPTDDLTL